MSAGPEHALAEVTVVAESGSCVIGNRVTGNYVAVPAIGGQIIRWLQAGLSPQECAERARVVNAGEPVDIADFLNVLADEQILRPIDGTPSTRPDSPRRRRQAGRVLFSRPAWAGYVALAAAAAVLLISRPDLRPVGTDAVVGNSPLASVLVLSGLTAALTVIHELAHVLAAAKEDLPCGCPSGADCTL